MISLPQLPAWLVNVPNQQATTPSRADSRVIQTGDRNNTLFRLGRALRRSGLSHDGITAALLAENTSCCAEPLPDDEVRQIVASTMNYTPTGGVSDVSAPHPL